MALKRYFSNADNTISNAYQANMTVRGTGSNMGASDILETFSILGQVSSSANGLESELSRILIQFPVSDVISDRAAGNIPASGSVSFYLKMYNAEHTRTTPKDFPKDVPWDHKGNIFICKYNFIALNALASMQRWHLAEKNKQDELGTSNVLSATKWIESPIITNILMQKINISEQKNQKFKLLKKNLEEVEKLDESSDNIFEELLDEINKIGVAAFIEKWKKKKNKK